MDATISTSVLSLISGLWVSLYGSTVAAPSLNAPVFMSYSGAAFAFFFSLAGSYSLGAKLVTSVEAGYFTFLEDF